jgi:hypothetical protein
VDDQELGSGRMSKKLCNASHGGGQLYMNQCELRPKSGVEAPSAWPKGHATDVQRD